MSPRLLITAFNYSLGIKLDANLLTNLIQAGNRILHHLVRVRGRKAESGTNADQTSDGIGSTRAGDSLRQKITD